MGAAERSRVGTGADSLLGRLGPPRPRSPPPDAGSSPRSPWETPRSRLTPGTLAGGFPVTLAKCIQSSVSAPDPQAAELPRTRLRPQASGEGLPSALPALRADGTDQSSWGAGSRGRRRLHTLHPRPVRTLHLGGRATTGYRSLVHKHRQVRERPRPGLQAAGRACGHSSSRGSRSP